MLKIEIQEKEIPVYDITVQDNENFFANNLLVHNCGEISIPAISPKEPRAVLSKDFDNNIKLKESFDPGMIALCNLSSINVIKWITLSDKKKEKMTYNLLRASDNLLDYAFYPSKEGEVFNKNYRAIGIGITNYAQFLAQGKLKTKSKEALKETNDLLEDIYYFLMKGSIKLAKERGRYSEYFSSEYSKGNLIFDLYQGPYNFRLNRDWKEIREDLKQSGARFSTLMAIAPTATSSLILNSTEGIEPPRQLVSMKTGTYTCKQLVPNIKKLRQDYELAWDIDSFDMINLSSARQRFIDQGQSLSLYYKDRNESATEVLKDIIYAEKMGLKSLYYAFTLQQDIEECLSCSV